MSSRRIVVHDYSGHPFQVQLSRALARRGHVVQHQYCSSYVSGHGRMARSSDDPATFSFQDVRLRRPFSKYKWGTRVFQEMEYAFKASRAILAFRPDVAVLCNIPLVANILVAVLLRVRRQPYVFWHQDVYSAAIRAKLVESFGRAGAVAGWFGERLERWIARRADRVVAITEAFLPLYRKWGIPPERTTVIPNWAAIDEIPVTPPDRGWLGEEPLRRHVLVYSGTLGIKHDPGLLLALAQTPDLDDCTLVVVSQGRGRNFLEERGAGLPAGRLVLRDFVDYDLLPSVLGSADVLLAVLEPDASRYSVPSKMLSYMCAGRPLVAVMDESNAAARTVVDEGMGTVVGNGDPGALVKAVRVLLDDPEDRRRMGAAARDYAERTFDIDRIAADFECQLTAAANS